MTIDVLIHINFQTVEFNETQPHNAIFRVLPCFGRILCAMDNARGEVTAFPVDARRQTNGFPTPFQNMFFMPLELAQYFGEVPQSILSPIPTTLQAKHHPRPRSPTMTIEELIHGESKTL